ncbi:archaeosortase B [Methanosalsum natronophilum]|uniref:Archaeosortase B n=1 Tax=Methanosalsum natronophilum TaxID=768733 RepID=A0A424Z2H5_9EURY|nr:MAG: archaeosortase B [Methanosalsum natronophilum]
MSKRKRPVKKSGFVTSIKEYFEKNKSLTKFIGLYVFYILVFTIIYIVIKDDIQFTRDITATSLGIILNVLGIENYCTGSFVYLENMSLRVIDECTGIYEILVYASCVLAYSTTISKKMIGLAFGIPAILGINMVRLVSLSVVGVWNPDLFDYIHYYFWQVTLLIIIAIVVIVWIEQVVKK